MLVLYPYKLGSRSAKALATALGIKRVKPDGNYRLKRGHTLINWGNSKWPEFLDAARFPADYIINHILNHPLNVAISANKLAAFEVMHEHGVNIPRYTTSRDVARGWIQNRECGVVLRQVLNGHSGRGILLTSNLEQFDSYPDVPLYVEYIKKKHEYRIHVFKEEVIDIQQKKRRLGHGGEVNNQIRNHHTGWVYCRDDINTPHSSILDNAVAAVKSLRLDFGAVDVIWNDHHQTAYVLEVNTAPGLEGTTLNKYVEVFQTYGET